MKIDYIVTKETAIKLLTEAIFNIEQIRDENNEAAILRYTNNQYIINSQKTIERNVIFKFIGCSLVTAAFFIPVVWFWDSAQDTLVNLWNFSIYKKLVYKGKEDAEEMIAEHPWCFSLQAHDDYKTIIAKIEEIKDFSSSDRVYLDLTQLYCVDA